MEDLGFKVEIYLKNGIHYWLRNVTEIHYNYKRFPGDERSYTVAFESDIHRCGNTHKIDEIDEFEATLEIGKSLEFCEE